MKRAPGAIRAPRGVSKGAGPVETRARAAGWKERPKLGASHVASWGVAYSSSIATPNAGQSLPRGSRVQKINFADLLLAPAEAYPVSLARNNAKESRRHAGPPPRNWRLTRTGGHHSRLKEACLSDAVRLP